MTVHEHLAAATGFEWNDANQEKNWAKHKVSMAECEQVFFNRPLLAAADEKHSENESRFYALGKTSADRKLFVVFTMREQLIRIISARDMHKKEREVYARL